MVDDWRRTFSLLGQALAAVLLCEGVGLVAGMATRSSVNTWYPTLAKPAYTPPDWVFAPTWIVLYGLMGISAFLIWRCGTERVRVRRALTAFAIQLGLNGGWSFAFFGARSPSLGLVVIVFLWLILIWTLVQFYRIRTAAGWLLAPYLAWVTYAVALNAGIWALN